MKKETVFAIKMIIATTIFIYSLFAFALWELSPNQWSKDARMFFALIEFVFVFISIGASQISNN